MMNSKEEFRERICRSHRGYKRGAGEMKHPCMNAGTVQLKTGMRDHTKDVLDKKTWIER